MFVGDVGGVVDEDEELLNSGAGQWSIVDDPAF